MCILKGQLQILPGRVCLRITNFKLSTFPDESQQNSSKGEIICFLANYRVKKQSLGSMKTTNPSSTLIFRSQKRRVWKKRESPPSYHRSPLQLRGWMSYHPVQKSWSMSTCQITIWTFLGAGHCRAVVLEASIWRFQELEVDPKNMLAIFFFGRVEWYWKRRLCMNTTLWIFHYFRFRLLKL